MKRRRVVVVEWSAFAVMIASAVGGWRLSAASGSLAAVRTGLFGLFVVAAFTLFVAVLVDFDRWVDDVRPYPKRAVRRRTGSAARAVARVVAWMASGYAAVMTWIWSRVGAALAVALRRAGRALVWASVWLARGASAGLARFRVAMTWLWSAVGLVTASALAGIGGALAAAWTWLTPAGAGSLVRFRAAMTWFWSRAGVGLVQAGRALTWLWAWLTRSATWLLVRFRAVMTVLWSAAGVALGWTLHTAGRLLARSSVWLTRAGGWLLVRFRVAMTLLWSSIAFAFAWLVRGTGSVLTSLWVWLVAAGAKIAIVSIAATRSLRHALAGGAREATTIRHRPWYTTAVDSVFGIPPDAKSLATRRRPRASRRPGAGRRGRPQRPMVRDDEATSSTHGTRATATAPIVDARARYVGRQVTRRSGRGVSERLLSSALARFRSEPRQPRPRDADEDD